MSFGQRYVLIGLLAWSTSRHLDAFISSTPASHLNLLSNSDSTSTSPYSLDYWLLLHPGNCDLCFKHIPLSLLERLSTSGASSTAIWADLTVTVTVTFSLVFIAPGSLSLFVHSSKRCWRFLTLTVCECVCLSFSVDVTLSRSLCLPSFWRRIHGNTTN